MQSIVSTPGGFYSEPVAIPSHSTRLWNHSQAFSDGLRLNRNKLSDPSANQSAGWHDNELSGWLMIRFGEMLKHAVCIMTLRGTW